MRTRIIVATGAAVLAAAIAAPVTSALQNDRPPARQERGPAVRGEGPQSGGSFRGERQRGRGLVGPGFGRGAFGAAMASPRMMRQLDLTDAQREQVTKIVRDARSEAEPVHRQLREVRLSLRQELFAPTQDAAKVAALGEQVTHLQEQVHAIGLKASTAVAAVLTPEQREKLRSLPEGRRGGPARGRAPSSV
jgi:Spy/CpxP family protein refolding chaperone